MPLRSLAASLLAIGLAAPSALAQQADPQMKQAAETIATKWVEAVNKGDGEAAQSLFAPDGFEINVYGRQTGHEIGEEVQRVHEMGIVLATETSAVKPLASGQMLLTSGTYKVTYRNNPATKSAEGNWVRLLVKDGSDWRILAQDFTRQAPPMAATGSSTAPAK